MDNLASKLFGNNSFLWERYRTLKRLHSNQLIDPRYVYNMWRPWTRREIFWFDMGLSFFLLWFVVMTFYVNANTPGAADVFPDLV